MAIPGRASGLIGERHVDVLVSGPRGPTHAIEEIAVSTGVVLPARSSFGPVAAPPQALSNLQTFLPIEPDVIAGLDRAHRLEVESLLLNFGNLVAVSQDQMIRSILVRSEETVEGRSRLDHRNTAEKLGAIPPGLSFQTMIDTRNNLARQYPDDPVKQAALVNDVASAAAVAITAFASLAAYGERLAGADRPE